MKKYFLLLFLVLPFFISACSPQPDQQPTATPSTVTGDTIEITSSGFNPNILTINAGDTVTFINKDLRRHWPASAIHPTHTIYPETGGCIGSTFDACRGLQQEESWSFTFNQKGEWKYHDHLNPSLRGTIIVQ